MTISDVATARQTGGQWLEATPGECFNFRVSSEETAGMEALTKFVPASQITYGTDYPYFGLGQFKDLAEAGLSAAELESIGSGNATRLLPRLRG